MVQYRINIITVRSNGFNNREKAIIFDLLNDCFIDMIVVRYNEVELIINSYMTLESLDDYVHMISDVCMYVSISIKEYRGE